MANTEGLSDEAMSSMLAMPLAEEDKHQRTSLRPLHPPAAGRATPQPPSFPRRSLARRELMMELGEGESPAAAVVRTSTAPTVHSSSSTKKVHKKVSILENADYSNDEAGVDYHPNVGGLSTERMQQEVAPQRVILSEYIRERPIITNTIGNSTSPSSTKPRESRFKQRNSNNNGLGIVPSSGGFPSLDIAPVGTLTRKGRQFTGLNSTISQVGTDRIQSQYTSVSKGTNPAIAAPVNEVGVASDSMLSNMSPDEIRESVDEIKSILSSESIEFLKKRGRLKRISSIKQSEEGAQPHLANERISPNTQAVEEKMALEKKERVAEVISTIRTPEDLDRVYNEALQMGLATELPSSTVITTFEDRTIDDDGRNERMMNLHTAAALLRSTAPRQRMLGAKCLMDILEEDVQELEVKRSGKSFLEYHDERASMRQVYPQLLPVALRCLLDESIATYQTPGGSLLLSITLRCIHALMTLFVHPYHVICLDPKHLGRDDPFVLYQTCFLSDISHIPQSTGLYPPTTIQPVEIAGVNNTACYKADSSAASAESDSKKFYLDPSWTLLSRMHLLPCVANVISCLSADVQKGLAISEESIRSICGILAMMTVRSPGAASAVAGHKGILPFLVSHCLLPSDAIYSRGSDGNDGANDMNDDLFNAELAIPTLILLCQLARQSRSIAEREMPFQTIMPFLQAILCAESESEIQSWSLILLRILMRYGIAIEHVQSLIHIAASKVEMMPPESSSVALYLSFFAAICDASKIIHLNESISGANQCLEMTGVWLSSSVISCFSAIRDVVKGSGMSHMKLAAAQLRFITSYISTSMPTMEAYSVPIVSKDSCLEVMNGVLESDMIENALTPALAMAFNATWRGRNNVQSHSPEEEVIACSFVSSFMNFVTTVGGDDIDSELRRKLTDKIMSSLKSLDEGNISSLINDGFFFHPARQSWLVESEFSVLSVLCHERIGMSNSWLLISRYAFSLLGRMNAGHESMAEFVLGQNKLFSIENKFEDKSESLQRLFRAELTSEDRLPQLNHSLDLFFLRDLCEGANEVQSLRCYADFVGRSKCVDGEDQFFLPVGGIWMWNVLSSSVTSQLERANIADDESNAVLDVVSQTLHLLLQLEVMANESAYERSVEAGTKLYHLASVCLLPERILSDGDICVAVDSMYKRLTGFDCSTVTDASLINDFVKACFEHSRISKESNISSKDDDAVKLHDLFNNDKSSSEDYSKDQLKALDDFVDDMCNAYVEYGGQYPVFTNFVRLFLRHDFPAKVISAVLTKLQPILHLLTIDGEDINALHFQLAQSISGGLPSMDSSRRDPSSVLDSFSSAIKKKDKMLLRNDYVYLLAIALLSRNLASAVHRCDCGVVAMKNRLMGVSDSAFYDIIVVSEKVLLIGAGTKEVLTTCLIDICMDSRQGLLSQDENTRSNWLWSSNTDTVWKRAVDLLKSSCQK